MEHLAWLSCPVVDPRGEAAQQVDHVKVKAVAMESPPRAVDDDAEVEAMGLAAAL
jgi:hypothetical protein